MNSKDSDRFANLAIPPLPPSLVREYARAVVGLNVCRLREARADLRAARRRAAPGWSETPRGRIEVEKQKEVDRLTDENVSEVRARLRELGQRNRELTSQEPAKSSGRVRHMEVLSRIGEEAWREAVARDADLAHAWEVAFFEPMGPDARRRIQETTQLPADWHEKIVGGEMLRCAAAHDSECVRLVSGVRAILLKRDVPPELVP